VKSILVILDGSPGGRKAAYTAYDIATRTGAKLIGAALTALQSQAAAEQVLKEFMTGARAAGVGVTGDYFPSLADAWLAFQNLPIDAIFISKDCLSSQTVLVDWLAQATCPLWIIPDQRDIRRLLALYDDSPAAPAALSTAVEFSRRWQLELKLLVTKQGILVDELLPNGSREGIQLILQVIPDSDLESLFRHIGAGRIDLAFVGKPDDAQILGELCQRTSCLLAICPLLNSS
jgi:hypothetical protein